MKLCLHLLDLKRKMDLCVKYGTFRMDHHKNFKVYLNILKILLYVRYIL